MKFKDFATNSTKSSIALLISLSSILLSCKGKIDIKDIEWCGDMGKIGAECDRTFTEKRRSLDKETWDKERVGMLCTDSSNVAHITASILKLCGETRMCSKEILDQIAKASARVGAVAVLAGGTKMGDPVLIKRTLKRGFIGEDVNELHKALYEAGYSSADEPYGEFDLSTENSVKEFQKDHGLTVDGIVGPQTWIKLKPSAPILGEALRGKGQTIIPFAVQHKNRMKNRGTYAKGYPKGCVVHFTAGQWESKDKPFSTIDGGIKNGYTFLCIGIDGTLVQAHAVNEWGWHAGESRWNSLVGSVSDDLIGIEINNPGKLSGNERDGWTTYFGKKIDPAKHGKPRYVELAKYGCPTGWYLPFSKAQEDMLVKTILWLFKNDPVGVFKIDNVVGHHEISGPRGGFASFRKTDPGGALSMNMDDFRKHLKGLV